MFKQFSRPSAATVEQQADRISDPLERLRYLRKHAPDTVLTPPPSLPPTPSNAIRARRQMMAIAGVIALVAGGSGIYAYRNWPREAPQQQATIPILPPAGPIADKVWQVEKSQVEEVYSNGLRIDLTFATNNRPRAAFPVFALVGDTKPIGVGDRPRGIVYHTTESDMVPFEEVENRRIARLGHLLLRYIRREHSYHYLIDRYGRVYRVVEESDAAYHAGFSVWADRQGLYVNLNDSFIGIAFEGKTDQRGDITAAQVAAARQLTELLRERYDIAPENCVTHAQVSVNPDNMKLANHMDWARGFPWEAFGLPDNYNLPVPAVAAFGFAHDEVLTRAAGGKDWPGLLAADKELIREATTQGASEERYRGMLRHRYHEILTDLRRSQPREPISQPSSSEQPAEEVPAAVEGTI